MSSHESFPLDTLDLVIADALQAQVGDVEPSPHVWRRIYRRAQAWAVQHHLHVPLHWGAFIIRLSLDELLTQSQDSRVMTNWRYNPATVRFMDYGGLLFRFGW
jgi:hypothetical protein